MSDPLQSEVSCVDLESVQWTDFFQDKEGNVGGVMGIEWKHLSSKQLRTVCSRLSVKGVKNAKKNDMVDRLIAFYENKKAYDKLENRQRLKEKTPRQQAHCVYRLINVLFSDAFAADFANIGNVASRQLLDTGKAANDQHFWERVKSAYSSAETEYDNLRFLTNEHLHLFGQIDPSKSVDHEWHKLCSIWKSVNADYKAALTRFTQSGTHDNNFYNFCNGRPEVYYLRKNLELRPGLNEMVEADLPDECALSSDVPCDIKSIAHSSASKRKRGNEIADAIRDFGNAGKRSELAAQKLFFMQKEDQRRDHKSYFEEWERIQSQLRLMRADLRNSTDDEVRAELQDDIEGLVVRKKELSVKLGYN